MRPHGRKPVLWDVPGLTKVRATKPYAAIIMVLGICCWRFAVEICCSKSLWNDACKSSKCSLSFHALCNEWMCSSISCSTTSCFTLLFPLAVPLQLIQLMLAKALQLMCASISAIAIGTIEACGISSVKQLVVAKQPKNGNKNLLLEAWWQYSSSSHVLAKANAFVFYAK